MSRFGDDGQPLVNVKLARPTHALLLRLKGEMLSTGAWGREPTLSEVVHYAVQKSLGRKKP